MPKQPDPNCPHCKGSGTPIFAITDEGKPYTFPCKCTADQPEEIVPMHERYI